MIRINCNVFVAKIPLMFNQWQIKTTHRYPTHTMKQHEKTSEQPLSHSAEPPVSPSVPARTFGKTGLKMPVLSLGMMRSRYSPRDMPLDQIPESGQSNLADLVDKALSLGMNHLETARNYGTSERQLAPILDRYERDSLSCKPRLGLKMIQKYLRPTY